MKHKLKLFVISSELYNEVEDLGELVYGNITFFPTYKMAQKALNDMLHKYPNCYVKPIYIEFEGDDTRWDERWNNVRKNIENAQKGETT